MSAHLEKVASIQNERSKVWYTGLTFFPATLPGVPSSTAQVRDSWEAERAFAIARLQLTDAPRVVARCDGTHLW